MQKSSINHATSRGCRGQSHDQNQVFKRVQKPVAATSYRTHVLHRGGAENAGLENEGIAKMQWWKTRDWKTRHQTAGVENAGLENAGV